MHHNNSQKTTPARTDLEQSAEKQKMSRVSFLVEKMHNGLSKPRKIEEYPSSESAKSSPAARRVLSPTNEVLSSQNSHQAVEDVVTVMSQAAMNDDAPVHMEHTIQNNEELAHVDDVGASSDFDNDEDFDYAMIDATNTDNEKTLTNVGVITTGTISRQPTNHDWNMTTQDASSGSPLEAISKLGRNPMTDPGSPDEGLVAGLVRAEDKQPEHDEFDEDDNDVFAADLEDVFAKYDTQPQLSNQVPTKPNEVQKSLQNNSSSGLESPKVKITDIEMENVVEVLSSDDEDFGDDAEFEQMCAMATQELEHEAPSQSMVNWIDDDCLYNKLTNKA